MHLKRFVIVNKAAAIHSSECALPHKVRKKVLVPTKVVLEDYTLITIPLKPELSVSKYKKQPIVIAELKQIAYFCKIINEQIKDFMLQYKEYF